MTDPGAPLPAQRFSAHLLVCLFFCEVSDSTFVTAVSQVAHEKLVLAWVSVRPTSSLSISETGGKFSLVTRVSISQHRDGSKTSCSHLVTR